MFWMLVGGGTLFALILAGVLMAILGGDQPASPPTAKPAAVSATPESVAALAAQKSEAAFLAEAEPMTRKFLEATRIGEILPLVRNPEVTGERMKRFYPDEIIPAPGMAAFNTQSEVTQIGPITSLNVRTREFEEKKLSFVETPAGIRIDWESWVGWSEMPWEEFLASKPTEPKVFRLNLSSIEYYNTAFTDDKKWQSYRLLSPDGKHAIYGYAERGSVLNARLRPPPDSKQVAMMLSLKFPENAASNNQVIIEKCIIEGWVLETEEPP